MGICRYCNTKAGLFKDTHESCWHTAQETLGQLSTLVAAAMVDGTLASELRPKLTELMGQGRLRDSDVRLPLIQAADRALLPVAQENPMSNEDADRIGEIFKELEPTWFDDPTKLVNWGGYVSLLHSNNLYQVLHGEIPYCTPALYDVFRLGRDEHPILKRGATLAEYRSVSTGRSYHSVGVPLGGGVYYRVGSSSPGTQQTGLVQIDQGTLLISTKAVYFGGQQSTFRLDYPSILRIESFTDGVGIHQNHGRGKVLIPYKLGDMEEGWYFYNLISALAARAN